jgi:hypothetical protein
LFWPSLISRRRELIFWSLSFPSENFGGHGKKVYGTPRGRTFAEAMLSRMQLAMQHDPVIRVYDDAGNQIETHDHVGDFRER